MKTDPVRIPYRGWFVLSGAFIAGMCAIGATHYSFSLFVVPASRELGLSRADANNALIAMALGSTLIGPVVGRIIDRVSVPAIMAVGGMVLASALFAISLTSSPLLIMLIAFGPLAFAVDGACGLAGFAVTARWFRRRRGRALGIMAVSASAGGFAVAPLSGYLIMSFGWRTALGVIGVLAGFFIVLAAILLVRSRPTEIELRAFGEGDLVVNTDPQQPEQRVWRYRELITNRNFWLVMIGSGLLLASDRAILVSIGPYLDDAGINLQMAAFILSTLTGSAIVGKLLLGYVAEFVDARKLFLLVAALHILLLTLLIIQPGYWIIMAASLVMGMGMGGIYPVKHVLGVTSFGSASYGAFLGLGGLILQPLLIVGLRFIGEVHDRTGSYDLAFQVFIGVVVLATFLIWQVRLPQKQQMRAMPSTVAACSPSAPVGQD